MAQSPDLNSIENLLEQIERQIRTTKFPKNQPLIDKINEVWIYMPNITVQKIN